MKELIEPTELTTKMKTGLARAYADEGFRAYVENAIAIANRNLIKVMDAGDTDRGKYFANRIATLKNLLELSKTHFYNLEKIKTVSNELQNNEKNIQSKDADEEIRKSQEV